MKPGENIRFKCGECLVVFDLCLAPVSEWPEEPEDESDHTANISVTNCPFCGANAYTDLTMQHGRATII